MPDRLREALFSALGDEIAGKVFVDLYAGSGAVGIEALSRGASAVVFVETDRTALAAIDENLKSLGAENEATVVRLRVSKVVAELSGDIFFLGPPYAEVKEYTNTLETLGRSTGPALVLAQHASRHSLEERYGHLRRVRTLNQGTNSVSFYRFDGVEP